MLDLSGVDISANGPHYNRGLEYRVTEDTLADALSKVFALETGRVLVMYKTGHWPIVDHALRHSTMWEYKVTAPKIFNTVMKCMASQSIGRNPDVFKADTVVYIDVEPPKHTVLDSARAYMKHTRKLGSFIFLNFGTVE